MFAVASCLEKAHPPSFSLVSSALHNAVPAVGEAALEDYFSLAFQLSPQSPKNEAIILWQDV